MPYRGYGYGGDVADYAMQQGQQSQENWNNLIQLIVSFLGQKGANEKWGQEFGLKQRAAGLAEKQFGEETKRGQTQDDYYKALTEKARRPEQPEALPVDIQKAMLLLKSGEAKSWREAIQKSQPSYKTSTEAVEEAGGIAGAEAKARKPYEKPTEPREWETLSYSQLDNIDKLIGALDLKDKNITGELKDLSDPKTFDQKSPDIQSRKARLKMHQSNITPAYNFLRKTRLKITAKQTLGEDDLRKLGEIAGDFGRVLGDRGFWEKGNVAPTTTQKDKYEVGKQYTNGAGETAIYLGNGQFRIVGK